MAKRDRKFQLKLKDLDLQGISFDAETKKWKCRYCKSTFTGDSTHAKRHTK